MKAVLQSLKTGHTEVADVPEPASAPGRLLVRARCSLISAGTERMVVEFARAGWLEKARQQPDKVRQVIAKVRNDGLMPTLETVLRKLDQPIELGYCHVGEVVEVGAGVSGFAIGDRVTSNGHHAELVSVPANLCARVPDAVHDETAAFTVIGAIALQGIRLAQPSLGDAVVVTGLGLVGLMAVQLLRAHGCRVLGLDFDPVRLELAREFGAEVANPGAGADPLAAALAFSRGRGVDAVIITATTDSSAPVHDAAMMCRKRGRIVLVGVTGLELSRADFYEKELTFQVSCSYGPGRYDPLYEDKGQDYPFGFVRWTEQRNFEAVLDMMADDRLNVSPLVSHRYCITDAADAYARLTGSEPSLGIVIEYPRHAPDLAPTFTRDRVVRLPGADSIDAKAGLSFIGAGNYATGFLIPAFKAAGAQLRHLAASGGAGSLHAARKFGFSEATTDVSRLFGDAATSAIVVATRHDSHARFVLRALEARKHVYVEKPLCLTLEELGAIEGLYGALAANGDAPILTVGFNRRFSPLVLRMKELLALASGPKAMIMTVNAGATPALHWTQDPVIGGGRIVGEACHFVDLMRHLAGSRIERAELCEASISTRDTATVSLRFANGSIGTIHYFANGHSTHPKERLEVFCGGRILRLDNFRRLKGFGWGTRGSMRLWRQDKGQNGLATAFLGAIRGDLPPPIAVEELFEVARLCLGLAR